MTGPDVDVEAEFDRAAARYDLLVRLNPGYHAHLRSAAQTLAARLGVRAGGRLLDLGCGSGASTRALCGAVPSAGAILGIDVSEEMLGAARRKAWPPGVDFVRAAVQRLPQVLAERGLEGSDGVDGVFAAYLLRNVPAGERDDVLAAIHDSLRPGGWFVTQEYSVAGRRGARLVWTFVCRLVVVPLSVIVRGHPNIYRYLWRSVLDFDSTEALRLRLQRAGFTEVSSATVSGWQRGILHTVVGRRR